MKTQKCKYLVERDGNRCGTIDDKETCPKSRLKGIVAMYCYKVPRVDIPVENKS